MNSLQDSQITGMKNSLIFQPIAFKNYTHHWEIEEYRIVPYTVSYVYSKDTCDVVYVIERIEKIWHFTKWENVESTVVGTKKNCEYTIREDIHSLRLDPDFNPNARFYKQDSMGYPPSGIDVTDIGLFSADQTRNGYGAVYDNIGRSGGFFLLYKVERINRKWAFGRWTGPENAIGTLKECRDAIREDFE